MQRPSKEERRKRLRERTKNNSDNRGSGAGGKRILDFSKLSDDNRPTFFTPKDGEFYNIDIIPYIVKSDHHPQKMKPGFEDYLLDIWVHRFVGPNEDNFVCLARNFGKPCPICEEADMLKKTGGDENEIKQLSPTRRCIYNIVDLETKEQKMQLFEVSYHLFEKLLLDAAQVTKDEIVSFSDLEDGKTIKFKARKTTRGSLTFLEYSGIGFIDRDSYDESILEESYSLDELLIVPSYEQIRNAFHGVSSDEAEEKPQVVDHSTRRRRPIEQKEESESVKRRDRSQRPETEEKGKCPYGHKFADDCDNTDDCPDCDIWTKCCEEYEKQKK